MKFKGLIATAMLVLSGAAHSYSVSFDLGNPVAAEGKYRNYANVYDFDSEGFSKASSGRDSDTPRVNSRAQIGHGGTWGRGEGAMPPARDGFGTDFDFLMFEFVQTVALNGVGLGYIKDGSDISIATMDASEILAFNSHRNADLGMNVVGPKSFAANIWIIGAFHSAFGRIQDSSLDRFRLDEISVDINPVPLPAAIWFLATGLVGFGWFRRRAAKQAV